MKKFDNFSSNLAVLRRAADQDLGNEFIISGIIDKFFIQFELGWKLLKELLRYEGRTAGATGSPREIIKAAYSCFDFLTEELWLDMLKDRNDMTHIYDGGQARKLADRIIRAYIPEFEQLNQAILTRYGHDMDKW